MASSSKLCLLLVMARLPAGNMQGGQPGSNNGVEVFNAEIFVDRGDLDAGLYEGAVRGRQRFGGTQLPHGKGSIYYFTNDPYDRQNYTGEWENGTREGQGTTYFKDGRVYTGNYHKSLETGPGRLVYPTGNVLEAEFKGGQAEGHGVLRYANGDQREGFFKDNLLDGQVIYTRRDGVTIIEMWKRGEITDEGEAGTAGNSIQGGEDETAQINTLRETIRARSGPKFSLPNSDRESKQSTTNDEFSVVSKMSRTGQSLFLRKIFDTVNS